MTGQTDKEIVIHHGGCLLTLSGKWNIMEEDFMKNVTAINNLSLRGSYGLTATAGPATNSLAIYRSFITDRLNLGDRETGLIDELQNADLTWEKQFETNIGLDLGIFNNRVQFTTDVYSRKAFDPSRLCHYLRYWRTKIKARKQC
jgi:hypothetical protein